MPIKVLGLKEFQNAIRAEKVKRAMQAAMRQSGQLAQSAMQQQTQLSYVKGYSTGATRASITVDEADGGLTQEIGPDRYYNPFTEYGTRHMSPEPIIEPTEMAITERVVQNMVNALEEVF